MSLFSFFRRKKGHDEEEISFETVYPESVQFPAGKTGGHAYSFDFNWFLISLIAVILGVGTVMVYSATVALADSPKYGTTPCYFLIRHLMAIALSAGAAFVVYQIPMRVWHRIAPVLAVIGIISLILVLVPGIGVSVNGSRRWIRFPYVNIQASEIMKFVAVIFTSYFTLARQDYMHSFRKGFFPMFLVLMIVAGLLIIEPDLGATCVVIAITLGILFLGGLSLKIFFAVLAMVASGVVMMIIWTPWRLQRFMAYLDPWNSENVLGKAYQLTHSLIAFGRGAIFGAGLGGSVEKLNYLPEAHTDFIFAVVGEELGFVGVAVMLLLYYRLIRSIFEIGRIAIKMDKIFSGLVAQGVGIWIGAQVCINVGVATGIFPTKGLTLPLMSYGGSALIVTMCALALVLRVDHENRMQMSGGSV